VAEEAWARAMSESEPRRRRVRGEELIWGLGTGWGQGRGGGNQTLASLVCRTVKRAGPGRHAVLR
jgi:hypothetical protein